MKTSKLLLFQMAIVIAVAWVATSAQVATSLEFKNVRLNPGGFRIDGELYATVDGKSVRIAGDAVEAWIVDDGNLVVFTTRDGAGTGDTQGHAMRAYDVKTRKTAVVMKERTDIVGVTETRLGSGKLLLLVRLSDGGSGAPWIGVVDPSRGQVYRRVGAEFTAVKGDKATIVVYRGDDWETMFESREGKDDANKTAFPMRIKARGTRVETLDLKALATAKTITVK